jgi:hypothetical protein
MRTLLPLLFIFAAAQASAADQAAARPAATDAMHPAAHTEAVVDIDANTRIRFDTRLRNVTGTDTAAAGASGSMEERHRRELKAGAAGPEEDTVHRSLPPAPASDQERKSDKLAP